MEQKLELIQNERFGELECSIYHDKDSGEYLFTREQIGLALEYENPRHAIKNIHLRHSERLDQFATRVLLEKGVGLKLSPTPSEDNYDSINGGTGGEKETVLYTRKGVFEICRRQTHSWILYGKSQTV